MFAPFGRDMYIGQLQAGEYRWMRPLTAELVGAPADMHASAAARLAIGGQRRAEALAVAAAGTGARVLHAALEERRHVQLRVAVSEHLRLEGGAPAHREQPPLRVQLTRVLPTPPHTHTHTNRHTGHRQLPTTPHTHRYMYVLHRAGLGFTKLGAGTVRLQLITCEAEGRASSKEKILSTSDRPRRSAGRGHAFESVSNSNN